MRSRAGKAAWKERRREYQSARLDRYNRWAEASDGALPVVRSLADAERADAFIACSCGNLCRFGNGERVTVAHPACGREPNRVTACEALQ